jgi:transposase
VGKKLKVAGPATLQEVQAAFKASQKRYERERLQAILLGQQGRWTLQEIAQALGRGRTTIARWVRVYRERGLEGLGHRGHGGRRAKLTAADQEALREGLKEGQWKTARQIQRWLQGERGIRLTVWGVYYWLDGLAGRWKVPRKSHIKKTLRREKSSSKRLWQS